MRGLMYELPDVQSIVASALAEDLGMDSSRFAPAAAPAPEILLCDVTTSATIAPDVHFAGSIVPREACIVCGLPVAAIVFETLSHTAGLFEPVEFFPLVAEGSRVDAGTPVAEVSGLARAVLAAERTALDFTMVLSGIATETSRWVALAGEHMKICDTRKTLPGLRALSKYAVRVGGGTNHRYGLYDMVLIKDNHLDAAGGVAEAVGQARLRYPDLTIEAEADSVDHAVAATRAGADIVLLDNMDDETVAEAVVACRAAASAMGREVLLEVSGGVARSRVPLLRLSGVDRVSSSALTFAKPVDFGLDQS
jgi:nicotinate-nucleotide pyrophosphorylase (carboxylating)